MIISQKDLGQAIMMGSSNGIQPIGSPIQSYFDASVFYLCRYEAQSESHGNHLDLSLNLWGYFKILTLYDVIYV